MKITNLSLPVLFLLIVALLSFCDKPKEKSDVELSVVIKKARSNLENSKCQYYLLNSDNEFRLGVITISNCDLEEGDYRLVKD